MRKVRISRWWTFFKLEFKLLLREPVTLFFMLVLPIIFTVVFGGTFGNEMTTFGEDILGIDTVVPLNVVFLISDVALLGLPITVIELRNKEVLKRYLTYPISYNLYFLALASSLAISSLISTFIFGTLSFVVYGAKWRMSLWELLLFVILYIAAIFIFDAIGYLLSLLIRDNRMANIVTSSIFLAMIFTSGIVMPIDSLPTVVQYAAKIFPMYYFVELFQYLWVSQFQINEQYANLIYIFIVTVCLAILLKKVKIKWD